MSRRFAASVVMSCPPTRIRPESSRSSPASARSAVVFPQPDGPEQRDQLAGGQLQGQPVQGAHRPVDAGHVDQPTSTPARVATDADFSSVVTARVPSW